MDKYQESALKQFKFYVVSEDLEEIIKDAEAEFNDSALLIKQGSDITITKYALVIFERGEFERLKVSFYINQKWITSTECYKGYKNKLIFRLDLKNPFEKIKIEQADNLIDPIELPVKILMASVEEYNKRLAEAKAKEEIKLKELGKQINPECKTGQDLVNIYWDVANRDVKKVQINLFSLEKDRERKVMSCVEDTNITFKSITGLARGYYLYEIVQLDNKGKLVAKTDRIKFSIGIGNSGVVFGR